MEKKKADFKAGKSLTVSYLHECFICARTCVSLKACVTALCHHILYLQVSGREVFEFRPELVDDDDAEADDSQYDKNMEDEEEVNLSVDCIGKHLCAASNIHFVSMTKAVL